MTGEPAVAPWLAISLLVRLRGTNSQSGLSVSYGDLPPESAAEAAAHARAAAATATATSVGGAAVIAAGEAEAAAAVAAAPPLGLGEWGAGGGLRLSLFTTRRVCRTHSELAPWTSTSIVALLKRRRPYPLPPSAPDRKIRRTRCP